MKPKRTDVLVAGAGPAGLAAALAARRHGWRVTLVSPVRPPDGRTSALLAGSVALLEKLGVWPELAGHAAPLGKLRIVDATQRLIRAPEVLFRASEIDLDAFGQNLANRDLLAGLEAAVNASGVERIDGAVADAETRDDSVEVTLEDGRKIEARLAVAADGRRSRLRDAAGIAVNEWRYEQAALVVNLAHGRPHDDTSTEFHTETGPFTMVPLPGDRSSLVWVDRPADAERRAKASAAELAAEIEEQSQAILGAVSVESPAQVFPLAGMTATRSAAGRIALVGEAAHLFPPIGAQGLNLGYRDVAALDALLADTDDPGDADGLDGYARARAADIATRTLAVDALNRTLLSGFLPVQALRGLGLFLLDRVPALREAVMRQGVAG